MAKYHINQNTGEPGLCRAKQGGCPFGGLDEHYTSKESARSAYETQMQASNSLKKTIAPPLPILSDLYTNSPRGNIGIKKIYSHLNGIEKDLTEGLIDDDTARARIASIVADLNRWDKSDSPEGQKHQAEINRENFRDELNKLAAGAEPAIKPREREEWKLAAAQVNKLYWSGDLRKDQRELFRKLQERLSGEGFVYDGYSDSDLFLRAEAVIESLSRAKKPELKETHRLLTESLAKAKRENGN